MHKRVIQLILLISLSFNIAHASIIASHDQCHQENANEYVQEQAGSQECNDLCDIHHFFHMSAIMTLTDTFNTLSLYSELPKTTLLSYHPPFKETENKPPIA